MDLNNKIVSLWERLFAYWKKNEPNFTGCKGATEKEILDLELHLGIKLPNCLKESLARCNTPPIEPKKVHKSSCLMTGCAGILYSIDDIKMDHQDFKEYMFDGGAYRYVDPNIFPKDIAWSNYWIPIYSWNCNEYALIDLRPECNNHGQILYVDPEFSVLGIWAKSYEEFLESIANAILDHGEFNQNDMKQIRDRIYKATKS